VFYFTIDSKRKMKLQIKRTNFTDKSTVGELYINDEFFCYTLEDVVREEKIKNETAIPAGEYEITITYSPRFKRYLPLLHDVPNFSGVRIHPGNTARDTEGCVLVGMSKDVDFIGRSREAFNKLYPMLTHASQSGEKLILNIR
jgi:hypothetical protein